MPADLPRCFHGGGAWRQVGNRLAAWSEAELVDADVLDAWFPPAPGVLEVLRSSLDWLGQTSPPTYAEALEEAIAEHIGVAPASVFAGPGSSSLIFEAMRRWLFPGARVLVVEPMYGEYAFLAERLGCAVERFTTRWEEGFRVDVGAFRSRLRAGNYDLVAIVNPNNPTGASLSGEEIRQMLSALPMDSRLWIDEAYIDYGAGESVQVDAANERRLFVVKSLSKSFALSGLRVAYLVGDPGEIEALRHLTPPWWVSLPAQLAAIQALQEPAYYDLRYRETQRLRSELARQLVRLGGEVKEGAGNWVLFRLPDGGSARSVVERCGAQGVYLRNAGATAPSLGDRVIRIAVKPLRQQERIADALQAAMACEDLERV